jgi:ABC-2 type transport system ATP-binding protein
MFHLKLTIRDITRTYKNKVAIDHVSAELTAGVYGLIGPNGAGKTTFMRMLADVLKPSQGSIQINNEDIRIMDHRYRELIGYLPQDCEFYSYFTANRFLKYVSALKGLDEKQALVKIDEMLHLVNLSNEKNKKIGSFSGGMKRRLGIAQALLNDPKILILDEPTSGLDPKERVRFRNLLSDISADRIVILSTHIISDIEYIAKEVLVLKEGKLIIQEAPETILNELNNKVWHVTVPANEMDLLEQRFTVGNLMRKGKEVEARIISDTKPAPTAIVQTPRLEDIYLYYFGEGQGDYSNELEVLK